MKVIRMPRSNSVRYAETPAELHVEVRIDGNRMAMLSTWEPSPEERIAIAEGANVVVGVHGVSATHPMLTVEVSHDPIELPPLEWPKDSHGRDRSHLADDAAHKGGKAT